MDVLLSKLNKKVILLGNEAIVRGALEEGVGFVSTYPGTPASEIGNIFFKLSQSNKYKGYFEFSTNEKVALEAGIGASFSGLKTLVAMKNFGLNVALDSLLPFVYTGSLGPTVIVVADDPSCHSSAESEENSRFISKVANIPVLEPSDPQECKDFTRLAFKISEEFKVPVIVRTTTRVAHQSAVVTLGSFIKGLNKAKFVKDQKRFVTIPPRVLEMKAELLNKIKRISSLSEKSKINTVEGKGSELAIITSGVSYLYVKEALGELSLNVPILKLGFFHPLAKNKIKEFIKPLKKVLVVEELEPYLEKEVAILAKEVNCKLKIYGKDLLPEVGELRPEIVTLAISKFANVKYKEIKLKNKEELKHLPRFCPGCPYWSVFAAIKKVVSKDVIFGGDIGCYMLGSLPPHSLYDYLLAMGSAVGIGHGISKSTNKKVITFMGDSTFFHSGVNSLVNAVFNDSNSLIVILDNGTTAMTGHQPNPGTSKRIDKGYDYKWGEKGLIKIEDVVSACGVKNLKIVDSFNVKEVEDAFKELLSKKEVSVIIARGMCTLLAKSINK